MSVLGLELPTFSEIKAQQKEARQVIARARLKEYRRRRFDAAVYNRLTNDWVAPVTSINAELRQGLRTMRARARELGHNDPYMKKFFSMMRANIVGPRGIRLQVRAAKGNDSGLELDTVLNTQVETAFKRWAHKENCTASQKLNWLDAQNLAVTQLFRDGECLIRKVTANNAFGFALKFIDVSFLDETYNSELPNGNRILMSVEVDQDEKIAAFYLTTPYYDQLYPQGPGAPRLLRRVRVPASEMIYLPFWLDDEAATRSAPASHAAMRNLRELGAFIEAKVIASRVEACQMGFLIPPEGEEVSPLDEAPVPSEIEAQPAIFPELPPGYDMKMFSPHNPNGQEGEFLKAMLKGIAVGFDVDYPTFASDLREVNFSSIRAGIQETRELYKFWQQWFIEHLHREVYLSWLRSAIALEAVEGVLPRDFERLVDPRWLPRGWGYVNPLQDVEADAMRVDNAFSTRTAVAADEGEDFEEILATLEQEKKLAAKYGIALTSTEKANQAIAQAQAAAAATNAANEAGTSNQGD